MTEEISTYPVLPLRDIVVFPHMIVPLFVGREKSINALEDVMQEDKQVFLATQKSASVDDLYSYNHLAGRSTLPPPEPDKVSNREAKTNRCVAE